VRCPYRFNSWRLSVRPCAYTPSAPLASGSGVAFPGHKPTCQCSPEPWAQARILLCPAIPLGALVVSDSGSETGAASRVHVWPDAVRCGQLGRAQCADQRMHPQSGPLSERLLGSGRRGREFKSPHPDQLTGHSPSRDVAFSMPYSSKVQRRLRAKLPPGRRDDHVAGPDDQPLAQPGRARLWDWRTIGAVRLRAPARTQPRSPEQMPGAVEPGKATPWPVHCGP